MFCCMMIRVAAVRSAILTYYLPSSRSRVFQYTTIGYVPPAPGLFFQSRSNDEHTRCPVVCSLCFDDSQPWESLVVFKTFFLCQTKFSSKNLIHFRFVWRSTVPAEMSVVQKTWPRCQCFTMSVAVKDQFRTLGSHLHCHLCCEVYFVKIVGCDLFVSGKWLLLSITRTVLHCPSLTTVTGKVGLVHSRLKPSGSFMYKQV